MRSPVHWPAHHVLLIDFPPNEELAGLEAGEGAKKK